MIIKTPMSPRARKNLAELVYRANVKLAAAKNGDKAG